MTEEQLKELGFKKEHGQDNVDNKPAYYYYVIDIGTLALITDCNDGLVEKNDWKVEFFEDSSIVIRDYEELKTLVEILKKNVKKLEY